MSSDEPSDDLAPRETDPAPPHASEEGPSDLVGQVLGERYRIEAMLGAGGMGAVYRAKHVHMKKAVAVKVLHKEMTFQEEVVKRFEREAVAAARIEHPNVAAATDFGRLDDGSFYLVLEYVEGRSLGELQEQEGPLPTERALAIARQISMALTAAHAAGIVHRDLKPDNVMLVEKDGDPDFVKVLDFGIAKLHGDDQSDQPALTRAGTVFGTPEYMAPEQAKGEPTDARSDLYTLGMILYEMLSGKSAFEGDDLIVVLTQQMASPPPPLPETIDSEVRALVMQLLEKDPSARVQTAQELTQKFDTILGLPPPSSVGYPMSVAGVAALSAMSMDDRKPGVGDRLGRLFGELRPGARVVLERAGRRVRLGPLAVPVWLLILPGVLLVAVLLASLGNGEHPERSQVTQASTEAAAEPESIRDLGPLMKRAESGDREALSELRAAIDESAEPEAWRALGRGYARIQHNEASLEAYATSLMLEPKGAEDRTLRADVRQMADDERYLDKALALAENNMGELGVDLLYDVWLALKSKDKKSPAADKVRAVLDTPGVRAKASPALKAAMALEQARSCADYKKVLGESAEHVDERSAAKLKRLQARKGCGFLGLRDCWGCLRGTKNLSLAVSNARRRAPSFAPVRAKQPPPSGSP